LLVAESDDPGNGEQVAVENVVDPASRRPGRRPGL